MNKADMRNRIRLDFQDLDLDDFIFSQDTIDRAIESACEDLSRFVPAELFHEIVVDDSDQSDDFSSTGVVAGTIWTLSFKPLKFNSVTVVQSSTTFTKNTDYIVDHNYGTITIPSGSAIIALADALTITVTYKKSRTMFDLSSLENLRQVFSVSIVSNPVNANTEEAFQLVGEFLVRSNLAELSSGYHIMLQYDARHTVPDDTSNGTLPPALDEVVIKGAEAFLLFGKAIALELEQSGNFNDLSDLDAYFTLILADMVSGRLYLADAVAAIASAQTSISAYQTGQATDYAAAQVAIVQSGAMITAAIASLVAATSGIDTEVQTNLAAAQTQLTDVGTQITSSNAYIAAGIAVIDTEVPSDLVEAIGDHDIAQGYLDLGLVLINEVNVGDQPEAYYEKYAEAALLESKAEVDVAQTRLSFAKEYLDASAAVMKQAEAVLAEIKVNLDSAGIRLSMAEENNKIASGYVDAAKTRLSEAQVQLSNHEWRATFMRALLDIPDKYIAAANGYFKSAETSLAAIQAGVGRAGEVRQQSALIVEIAEKIRAEANSRYSDFKSLIADRNQTRRRQGIVAKNQI